MNKKCIRSKKVIAMMAVMILVLSVISAEATIDGLTGMNFSLTAKTDHISTADGGSLLIWGYANGAGRAQYPGPTLIINQGDTITVELTNNLNENVSIVFPGQTVAAQEVLAPTSQGSLTLEAAPGGTVRYTFTATDPGTYLYYSGTRPELQIEMGLVGAMVVRPNAGADHAYNHPDTQFDHEYLFLLSEMDHRIHHTVEFNGTAALEGTDYLSSYFPVYWFINGRTAPDTLVNAGVEWLPTQPYNSLPRMHPGERVLLRVVGAGRQLHPFHHHGNHSRIIARDGKLLSSTPASGPDLGQSVFTIKSVPGETVDAIFEWTGRNLGWDIYGTPDNGPEYVHTCSDGNGDDLDDVTFEYCPDHYKPIPVILPEKQDVAFGGFYSGSPFLGVLGSLPPGEGGLNPYGAFTFVWHSHTEKELTNFDIFPGGLLTVLFVEPHGVPIQ